ncbi:hypothetical protein E2320_022284, partial [Naja naja]
LGVGFEFSQGDRRVYPSFFQINPKEFAQSEGLVQLLLHFQWNWVGLVAPENDNGELFISSLVPMLEEKEICLAFTQMITLDFHTASDSKVNHIFNTWSKGEVIILFGDSSTVSNVQAVVYVYGISRKASFLKVWIFTSNWKLNVLKSQYLLKIIKPFHGALNFRHHTCDVSEFSHILLSLDPLNPQVLLWMLPEAIQMDLRPNCFWRRPLEEQKDYYRPGDLVIGGNLPLSMSIVLQLPFQEPPAEWDVMTIDPQYHLQNAAIVWLLLYFQWNWIGIVVQRSESSDHFIRIFDATLAQNDICIHFVKQIIPIFPIFNILIGDLREVLWTILNSDAHV